jgi:hypothetical protein
VLWLISQIRSLVSFIRQVGHFDLVHISYSLNPPSIVRDFFYGMFTRLFGKKLIVHVHGGKYLTQRPASPLLNAMIRGLLGFARRVIVLAIGKNNCWRVIMENILLASCRTVLNFRPEFSGGKIPGEIYVCFSLEGSMNQKEYGTSANQCKFWSTKKGYSPGGLWERP